MHTDIGTLTLHLWVNRRGCVVNDNIHRRNLGADKVRGAVAPSVTVCRHVALAPVSNATCAYSSALQLHDRNEWANLREA